MPLGRTPYPDGAKNSGFYFGAKFGKEPGLWLIDPWGKKLAGAPISEQARRELLAMRQGEAAHAHRMPERDGDAISRHLDSITLEQDLMETYGLSQVLIPDALSGAGTLEGVCKSIVNLSALDRAGHAARIRVRSTAVAVQHDTEPGKSRSVKVVYTQDGKLYSLRARSVIMAGGSWTTKHIVKNLPAAHRDAYAQFYRAPCLMANVALRDWRFLYKLGISECQWFEGIGNYTAVRKMATFGPLSSTEGPESPVVLTLKILFSSPGLPIGEQVMRGRAEPLSTPFREYERRIREQFILMFSEAGFDARRDIAGIILNRWGHAYLSAQPSFFFGKDGRPAPGEVLRNTPFGRIAFANSDLTGIMDHRASILEAHRAVGQVVSQVTA